MEGTEESWNIPQAFVISTQYGFLMKIKNLIG